MALKGKWVDKIDGVDINSANDINQVAQAVMELEDALEESVGGIDKTLTIEGKAADAKAVGDALAKSSEALELLASRAVLSVNGKSPDENGNVEIEEGGGGIANETDPTIYVGSGDAPAGTKVQINPEGETMEILTPDDVNEVLEEAKASGMFDGAPGTSVTVESVTESTASGGTSVVTFSDGSTLNVKNGADGADGAKGDKGDKGETGPQGPAYTLTDSDRDTIASAVKASLPTLTLTGKDADGVSHTWTVYGT